MSIKGNAILIRPVITERSMSQTNAGRYTFAALSTTDALIAREPERVAAAVRAIVRTQRLLKNDPARATEVGRLRFPPAAAEIITDRIRQLRSAVC